MSLDFASGTVAAVALAPHVAKAVDNAMGAFRSGNISSVSVNPGVANRIGKAQLKERAASADELFGSARAEAIKVSLVSPADEANQNPKISAKAAQVMQGQGWKSPAAKAANNVGNNRSNEDQASLLGAGSKKHVHLTPQQEKILAKAATHVTKGNAHGGHKHTDAIAKHGPAKGGISR